MANQVKKIRELESFVEDKVNTEDYLIVATNSDNREITKKAHIREVVEAYDASKAEQAILEELQNSTGDSDIATRSLVTTIIDGVEQQVDASGLNSSNISKYLISGSDGSGLQAMQVCYDNNLKSVACTLADGTANPLAKYKTKKIGIVGVEKASDYDYVTLNNTSPGAIDRLTIPTKEIQYTNGVVTNIDYYPGAIFQFAEADSPSAGVVSFGFSNNFMNPDFTWDYLVTEATTRLNQSAVWALNTDASDWQYLVGVHPEPDSPGISWWTWSDEMQAFFFTSTTIFPYGYVQGTFEGTTDPIEWVYFGTQASGAAGKVYIFKTEKWVSLKDVLKVDPTSFTISAPTLPSSISDIPVGTIEIEVAPR